MRRTENSGVQNADDFKSRVGCMRMAGLPVLRPALKDIASCRLLAISTFAALQHYV